MADLEIYVNGIAGKQVQSANAIVDTMSATIMKQYNPGLSDPQLRQLIAAHIDDDSFCRYVIQQESHGGVVLLRSEALPHVPRWRLRSVPVFLRYRLHRFQGQPSAGKIRVYCQFTQEGIIYQPTFQEFNHIITQTQVCKISVLGDFLFGTAPVDNRRLHRKTSPA